MLTISDLVEEYHKLKKELDKCLVEHQSLLDENRYLKQKVKEYRHKTWFPVYKENLELQEQLKKHSDLLVENTKLFKENQQYETVLKSVEKFIGQYSKEKREDLH
jgi:predicted nuclease with TOPRIM domain